MPDDFFLPQIELFRIVVERRQGGVFEPGLSHLSEAGADLRRGAEQVAGTQLLERAVRAHHPLDQWPLYPERHRLVIGRHDMQEIDMAEGDAVAPPADLGEPPLDLRPI